MVLKGSISTVYRYRNNEVPQVLTWMWFSWNNKEIQSWHKAVGTDSPRKFKKIFINVNVGWYPMFSGRKCKVLHLGRKSQIDRAIIYLCIRYNILYGHSLHKSDSDSIQILKQNLQVKTVNTHHKNHKQQPSLITPSPEKTVRSSEPCENLID